MAGSLEHIKKVSGTEVTTLTTPQVFSDKFNVYYVNVQWERVTTYPEVYMTDSSNARLGGVHGGDSHYRGAMLVMKSNASSAENRVGTATYVGWRELGVYVDNVGEGYGMSFYVYNPFDSSKYTHVMAQSAGMISDNVWSGKSIGLYQNAVQCNGLHFANSSGTACKYIIANIYGVK